VVATTFTALYDYWTLYLVVATTLVEYLCGDYKRTQQGVPTMFLYHLYKVLMVHTSNK